MVDVDQTLAQRLLAAAAGLALRAADGGRLDDLFQTAGQDVASQLQVDVCGIWELLPENALLLRSVVGADGEIATPYVETLNDSPLGRAVLSRGPVLVNDLGLAPHFSESPFFKQQRLVGCLVVPIFGLECVAGAVTVHSRTPRDFMPTELHFLQIVAQMLSTPLVGSEKESEQRQKQLIRSEQMMATGQVAAGFAHELRNPLTAIKGLIQVNRRELEDRNVPCEDLNIIEHEIRRMERSLQNFLDFARPPIPKRQPLELMPIIERVISLVHGRARKQQVTFEIQQPHAALWVEADQDLIQQLLLNLVLNALDAMPQGGMIQIDVDSESNGQVQIRVCDNGPGIATHILPVIFERFVSSKETGVGLGLPVSRRIAQEHGGDLLVENLPQGGASFTFHLPATETPS